LPTGGAAKGKNMNRLVNVIGTSFSLLVLLAANNGIANGAESTAQPTSVKAAAQTESYFAKAQASRNAKDYKEALKHINKVIELDPNNPKWHCEAAAVSVEAGDADGAKNHIDQATKLDSDNSAVTGFIKTITDQARANNDAKQWILALHDFNIALAFKPKDVTLLMERSAVKHRLRDYNGSVVDMNTAIELSPDVPDLYALRSLYKVGLGDFDSADADCDKAEMMQANPKLTKEARIAIEEAMSAKKKK
jgi:Flp pilus assembly protein TadD